MILHHIALSRSFRVLFTLEELGLEADLKYYSVLDGSLRSPEFLQISPAGRVPALEFDDGRVMFESGPILQFLAETHPEANLGRPVDHSERARFLEMLSLSETISCELEMLNMQHLFLREPKDASATVIKLNTLRFRAGLRAIDAILANQDWLCESGFSAADIMMSFNILVAPYFLEMSELPNINRYREQLEERAAFRRARAKDGEQKFYDRDFYPVPTS
ncbi:MAG: glutathione S-transferase family protein [Aestuariivita sp.]|nr:glutathione S-transferase family protein [Aestuariivita sp.]MCY4201723.1 glutathione S-transferase family protein [Aestuariivita sp.]MCY4288885.1 glutathione S-transferase family protein [Aestuariivita sp.]MCY4346126.1 glutathione S-transferase family protein [Aestuariivita sp.]